MAEQLDIQSMLGVRSEPKRKFRWTMNIDGIDVFLLKSAARPQVTFAQTLIPYQNITRKYSGKPEWADLPVTLVDYISPSAAQKVWEKMRRNYDPVTGMMGYPDFYQEDATLKMNGPNGEIVERWTLKDVWFGDINWNELDYSDNEGSLEITFNLVYNWAILEY